MSIITGKTFREEATEPSFVLNNKIRARRTRWVGHVLREDESYLVRKLLIGYIQSKLTGAGYPPGSLLMDTPTHKTVEELVALST